MSSTTDAILAVRIGRRTVAENLVRAIDNGILTRSDDGALSLPPDKDPNQRTIYNDVRWPYPCKKLLFLFEHIYERAQVPWICRNCYKVKIKPRTVRELVAVLDATVRKPYPSKFQPDIDVPYSPDLYGAYFYADGLEQVRSIYKDVRATLDGDERLKSVQMVIKRGCTEYEMHCGPSDRYTFPDGLAEIESYLLSRISTLPPSSRPPLPRRLFLVQWIKLAYRIGDESYLELTGGRRLFPETVGYEP